MNDAIRELSSKLLVETFFETRTTAGSWHFFSLAPATAAYLFHEGLRLTFQLIKATANALYTGQWV